MYYIFLQLAVSDEYAVTLPCGIGCVANLGCFNLLNVLVHPLSLSYSLGIVPGGARPSLKLLH